MKTKRIHAIESYINEHKAASIDELSDYFNVSINTIRRDIAILADTNKVKKVYGGVKSIESSISQAVDYSKRNIEHYDEKIHIAKATAKHIQANDVIYIDTGTTTVHILDYVDTDLPFTVISNSLDVINKAALFENVSLLVIGEKYKYRTRSFIGIESNTLIEKLNIDKAFMAATGVDIHNGLTNAELEENIIKKLIVSRSRFVYALADHTKMGKSTLLTFMECDELDTLITNKLPSKDFTAYFKSKNITIET